MKIAIIGSGISGLSFWLFLQKLGVLSNNEVNIYEARPAADQTAAKSDNAETYNASVIGASIGLSTNGLNVLKRLEQGLYDEVTAAGHVIRTCKITNARGWTVADVPIGPNGEIMLMIGREAFWQILRRKVPDSSIVRKKVTKVDIGDKTNVLVFSDGTKADADLVVGADGIWSVVRRAIFGALEGRGEYEYSPHYEGLVGVGGIVPSSLLANDPVGEMDVVFGANGFFGYSYMSASNSSSLDHGDKASWWSTYSLDKCPEDWRQIDKTDANQQLQRRHGGWKNQSVQNIIRDVKVDSVYPMFTTPLLSTWQRNGAVLVGDAAHALQPSSGQGASMALEDSEALALFLNHYLKVDVQNGHIKAVKQYSDLRKPRVGLVHKKAQETGALKQDMGATKEIIMYFFIWMINRFHLSHSYNSALYDYDGPTEVNRRIQASAAEP